MTSRGAYRRCNSGGARRRSPLALSGSASPAPPRLCLYHTLYTRAYHVPGGGVQRTHLAEQYDQQVGYFRSRPLAVLD